MSTRLFLVRHGASVWNAEQRLQGQANPPLSVLGTQQACALAEALSARPLSAIYCSPLVRARETAAYIAAPFELTPRVDAALQEVNLGAWQGHAPVEGSDAWALYHTWRTNPAAVRPPDGETLAEALARVAPAIDAIVSAHDEETIVVVTHSIVGRVALCHLLGFGLEAVPRLALKKASITKLRVDSRGAVLECLGDTGHLRTPGPAQAAWTYAHERVGA